MISACTSPVICNRLLYHKLHVKRDIFCTWFVAGDWNRCSRMSQLAFGHLSASLTSSGYCAKVLVSAIGISSCLAAQIGPAFRGSRRHLDKSRTNCTVFEHPQHRHPIRLIRLCSMDQLYIDSVGPKCHKDSLSLRLPLWDSAGHNVGCERMV